MTPRPLNPYTFPQHMREHVRWHLLFTRADSVAEHYGLGLASVWGLIKSGRYADAVAALDDVEAMAASAPAARRITEGAL